jgi:signal transduction histidine kinase
MAETFTVALVAPASDGRAETAAGLEAVDELAVRAVDPDDSRDLDPDAVDVVVVFDPEHLPPCRARTCLPVVLYGEDPLGHAAAGTRVTSFARRGDATALRDQVRWVVQVRRDTRLRLEELHHGTAALVGTRSRAELYEHVVDIAEHILAFDNCDLMIAEDGEFVSKAARGAFDDEATTRLPLDHGLLGETYRTGESHLIRDVQQDEQAEPAAADFRAGISVPFGDVGVLQAVSSVPNVFDRTDVRLLELLTAYATEILSRIDTEVALRDEHERLRALFDNVPDAAVEYEFLDGEPIVRAVNDVFVSVFGFDRETIVGENLDDFVIPPVEDEASADATVELDDELRVQSDAATLAAEATMLNEKLKRGESYQYECRRQTTAGSREFLLQLIPLNRDQRNVAGYAIYTDISEQKQRERELRRQNERLEEFANIVSHDLRNPLGIAQGHLELARETGSESSFETAADALGRMDRLIEDVLSLARQGRVVGDPRPVNVAAVARSAWNTVDTEGASFRTECSIEVVADQGRLRELFENLFRNAIEHGSTSSRSRGDDSVEPSSTGSRSKTDDGAARADSDLTVTVEATEDGFAVVDDGPGVPDDERGRVFESGYTSSESGTGFGLAIVRQIAEAHDWAIELAASEADEGARFEIRTR